MRVWAQKVLLQVFKLLSVLFTLDSRVEQTPVDTQLDVIAPPQIWFSLLGPFFVTNPPIDIFICTLGCGVVVLYTRTQKHQSLV